MRFFIKIIKALILKKKLSRYKIEKNLSLKGFPVEIKEVTVKKPGLLTKYKKSSWYNYLKNLKDKNHYLNFLWKSLVGFCGGVLLTYIFFVFFNLGVNYSLKASFYICVVVGIIFCLGLAFSSWVRCYVLLLLPAFFSKQGRRSLITYAFFLTVTGPAKNITRNMAILSDSMACGQDELKNAAKQIYEIVKTPFKSIKDTIMKITESLKEVVQSIKEVIANIKRIIMGILNVIKTAIAWLGSIVNFCNKKLGTPFERCMRTLDDAIEDCKAKLGVMDFLCHVVHVVKGLCYTVKWLDLICMFTDFVSDVIVGAVKRKLKEFSLHIKNIFYVSVEFSHTYEMESKASNSTRDIAKSIVKEIKQRIEKVQKFFTVINFFLACFFLFLFFRVYYYRYKYLSSDKYDNHYINKYIVELDLRRAKMDKETVLPLEPREKNYFIRPTSIKLLKVEKERLFQAAFFLSLSTVQIVSFIAFDYSFFWVLSLIHAAGFREFEKVRVVGAGVNVEGKGIIADFYRKLGSTFKVGQDVNMNFDPVHCLPDPFPPDKSRYMQIGFLMTTCWILTITESYGLRLRNIVMSHYFPERARERAVWLYNHILRSRGGFLKFARRQLRRRFQGKGEKDEKIEKISIFQRLKARFPLLNALFGRKKENACILCGQVEDKDNPLKRCQTPDCPGKYCLKCYATLQNICTICQNPIEYGDLSDVSEEKDSSDEDLNEKTDDSRTTSDFSQDEAPKTFKEVELREKFRDVEVNKKPDLTTLSDFEEDTATLRRRVKEAIQKKMKTLGEYKSIENKTNLIKEIKRKVSQKITKLESERFKEKPQVDYKKILKRAKKLAKKITRKKENNYENKRLQPEWVHNTEKSPNYKSLIANVKSKIDKLSQNKKNEEEENKPDFSNRRNAVTYNVIGEESEDEGSDKKEVEL